MRAEILSYSRSRGVFAGVALEGDSLRIDAEANERFYGKRDVKVADIVEGKVPAPEAAAILRLKLAKWPEKVEVKPATLEPPQAAAGAVGLLRPACQKGKCSGWRLAREWTDSSRAVARPKPIRRMSLSCVGEARSLPLAR